MTYPDTIAARLALPPHKVAAAVALLDEGNTLPFIARYRKERTGELDEEQLRQIIELLEQLRSLDDRRATILAAIEEQGKLSDPLRAQIAAAATKTALEDLYAPYKQKRRTRATVAREKGLQPLADLILRQAPARETAEQLAGPFLSEQVNNPDEALAGARDIVAEMISEHPDVRHHVREKARQWALVRCEKGKAEDAKGVFQSYYEFEGLVSRLKPYQVLAVNRGEAEGVLKVSLEVKDRDWRGAVEAVFRSNRHSPLADQLRAAIDDAAERLLLPAIERDVRRLLSEAGEEHAIAVFASNLRALLLQPPLAGHTMLGIDPGFRTGCKLAVVDPTGKLLATSTVYLHHAEAAQHGLRALIAQHGVSLITIGNGTASRETEQLVAKLLQGLKAEGSGLKARTLQQGLRAEGSGLKDLNLRQGLRADVSGLDDRTPQPSALSPQPLALSPQPLALHYLIVNEAGASVYSASPLARAELPELDVSLRGAVSIARRAQDPLAELVKIEPKAIGVGLYQHDVDQRRLDSSLAGVVESVVNQVGVDLNTASPALLSHVAGIGPKLAEKIVAHREGNGAFASRKALRKVGGLGPKAFEQAAGFLRVRGDEPLDGSAIHPESYAIAGALLGRAGVGFGTPPAERERALAALQATQPLAQLAAELGAGV
ncbi:MAG: helix-hairpin-helix domain-containing protein, partial [Roseiflexaceae bacterium]|nr:helix-hairpin-helix domain-containing protein [Roseiflexaceae bacterium]